jgi:hypothetical protein
MIDLTLPMLEQIKPSGGRFGCACRKVANVV